MPRFTLSQFGAAFAVTWGVVLSIQAPASGELLLFYDFNTATDPSVAVDVSGKGNDGDVVVAEYTAPGGGRSGGANDRAMDFLSFLDPAYVDIPSVFDGAFDSIADNDAITISLWLYGSDEQPVDGTVAWFAGDDNRQIVIHVPWSDSIIYFDMAGCDSCLNIDEPDETKYKGQWNHYAFVKGGERAAIYQDGDLLIETLDRPEFLNFTTARFGTFTNDAFPYAGLMDDIGVWDEMLSDAAIASLAAGNNPVGGVRGDFNADGSLDAADIDALTAQVLGGTNPPPYDLNSDQLVNDADRVVWVHDLKKTYFGDANLDGLFDSTDFVSVFQTGEYEDATARNSTWGKGDWNGDGDFTSGDFVTAFQDGGYEKGPRPGIAAVPEPSACILAWFGLWAVLRWRPRPK
jgi:hypothetical protein